MEFVTRGSDGEFFLPICISDKDIFSSDNHGMFRIVFVEAGTGIISLNNKTLVFMYPSIFCLNELDTVDLKQGNGLNGRVIYFDPSIINDILTIEKIRSYEKLSTTDYQDYFLMLPFLERNARFYGKFDIGLALEKRLKQLINSLKSEITMLDNDFWPCRTRSFLLEILFIAQYMYTDSKMNTDLEIPSGFQELSEIILYLHTNYQKKLTIDELQNVFHMNRTTLTEKFHEATGMTIIEYLIKLRMKIAAMMIRDTLLPISEIMYRTGFNDSTHFNRTFKKYYGYSPSEYRKM